MLERREAGDSLWRDGRGRDVHRHCGEVRAGQDLVRRAAFAETAVPAEDRRRRERVQLGAAGLPPRGRIHGQGRERTGDDLAREEELVSQGPQHRPGVQRRSRRQRDLGGVRRVSPPLQPGNRVHIRGHERHTWVDIGPAHNRGEGLLGGRRAHCVVYSAQNILYAYTSNFLSTREERKRERSTRRRPKRPNKRKREIGDKTGNG